MKRILLAAMVALGWPACAQVVVKPITQPHQYFVDASGAPCAGCSLYSYLAGTTTPQPTYTDSTGGSQNTNPLVLDTSGSGTIWTAPVAYKFVLRDMSGAIVWTVDNVPGSGGGGSLPCSTPYAVQIANATVNALTCDPTITIDPAGHAIKVGGTITGARFWLTNLSTILNSWTFDVTSPSTALASLGAVPLTDLATQAADSVVMNATGGAAAPTAVSMPTGCTLGVNYSTSTHTWSCTASSIPLTSLATQAADTVVMNATGGSASPTAVAMPTGCTAGVNYNDSTHTWTCAAAVYNPADHDVTLSRAFGTTYQNTNSGTMRIYGYGSTGGSSVGSMEVRIGPSSASSTTFTITCGATVSGGACGFVGEVPASWYYAVVANTKTGGPSGVSGLGSWHEVY